MKIPSRGRLALLMAMFIGVGLLMSIAVPASAQNLLELTFRAQPTNKPLERKLMIVLKDGGKPVSDAIVEIDVDMPSMPMMHRVPKTKAMPSGAPGEYSANIILEMPGEWAARVAVDKPRRTTAVYKFQVE
ncbi:MAG: FixH family protein [Alphaproteobacteria bacterium]|nr:FixH family protein [Alphaproteobacteria bacterium]MBM3732392.1 FixH family protein [Acidimicrobiia bacterium]MBM3951205.1 FixH family protein [Rhodospirillales bacterium]